jgi:hypothetical protein
MSFKCRECIDKSYLQWVLVKDADSDNEDEICEHEPSIFTILNSLREQYGESNC